MTEVSRELRWNVRALKHKRDRVAFKEINSVLCVSVLMYTFNMERLY